MTRWLSIAWFVLAGLGLVVMEWAARRPDSKIPTLGDVLGVVMRYRVGGVPIGRILVLAVAGGPAGIFLRVEAWTFRADRPRIVSYLSMHPLARSG